MSINILGWCHKCCLCGWTIVNPKQQIGGLFTSSFMECFAICPQHTVKTDPTWSHILLLVCLTSPLRFCWTFPPSHRIGGGMLWYLIFGCQAHCKYILWNVKWDLPLLRQLCFWYTNNWDELFHQKFGQCDGFLIWCGKYKGAISTSSLGTPLHIYFLVWSWVVPLFQPLWSETLVQLGEVWGLNSTSYHHWSLWHTEDSFCNNSHSLNTCHSTTTSLWRFCTGALCECVPP